MIVKSNIVITSDKLVSNNLDKSFFQYINFKVFPAWLKLWLEKSVKALKVGSSGIQWLINDWVKLRNKVDDFQRKSDNVSNIRGLKIE